MSLTATHAAAHAINVEQLRQLAKQRVPRFVFDYIDGGADAEITLEENCRAFREVEFRPRQAVNAGTPDLRTCVLGHEISFPALLAPIGFSRLMHPGGEIAAAKAAGDAGTIYILSTLSGHSLEKVKAATKGEAWYQLYLTGGREAAESGIRRAADAGFSALVITVDTPVAGNRERDIRNGMPELVSGSVLGKLPFLPQILARPRWLAAFLLDGGAPKLENVVIPGKGPMPPVDVRAALEGNVFTWKDLAWIRPLWKGPILIKGILTAEDAQRAIEEGAAGLIVSNHGGRQLDGASASLRALPEIVAAVGNRAEVLMDGGIRRGGDIVKAICLGARAVLIGRAYVYGLAAGGEAGVARAIEILRSDAERTLTLLGCPCVSALNRSYVGA